MRKKTLKWGRTPWDKMTRKELLFEVKRMYSALLSVNSELRSCSFFIINPYYFGKTGGGGRALEKARQVLESIHNQYKEGDMSLYTVFFRYADDLLFDRSTGYRIGSGWAVCPVCGMMISENGEGESMIGKPCEMGAKDCPGIFRALSWEDLAPEKPSKG